MAVTVCPAREPDRLAVHFTYARDRVKAIRSVPGRRWHPERRCWTVPRTEEALASLRQAFSPEPVERHDGRHLHRMAEELKLRGYSRRTRKAYLGHVRRFLEAMPGGEPSDGRGLRAHLVRLLDDRALSHAYVNQCISALKFFYGRVLGREAPVDDLPRPRRERKLPAVLSRSEVARALGALSNPKHRALLMLTYAAGLRVGEVVRLRVADLDVERRLLTVRRGKGRKDRRVMLSERALAAVRAYQRSQPSVSRGGAWLFPGAREGRHLHERSAQRVFKRALRKAGVEKRWESTPCGTPSPPTCWSGAPTSASSRSCWATPALAPPRSTPT